MKPDKVGNKEGNNESKPNMLSIMGSMLGGSLMGMFSRERQKKDPALLWLALEADLKHAIKNKELIIHYQPIVDLQTDKVFGMEALLRWEHPYLGIISPIDLFPVAEATGLSVPIGEWVLKEACSQATKWHRVNSHVLKLFINISITQLREANFLDVLHQVLKSTKTDPKLLVLEFSQTVNLEKEDVSKLNEISKIGIGLSIDDFGTANSKWNLLKSFGIIKIDNAMIQMINNSQDDSGKIVSAIFAMAKHLGIKTLAEGVETQEQYQFLKNKKCDFMQGYYFSKPLDTAEFTQLLKMHKS